MEEYLRLKVVASETEKAIIFNISGFLKLAVSIRPFSEDFLMVLANVNKICEITLCISGGGGGGALNVRVPYELVAELNGPDVDFNFENPAGLKHFTGNGL